MRDRKRFFRIGALPGFLTAAVVASALCMLFVSFTPEAQAELPQPKEPAPKDGGAGVPAVAKPKAGGDEDSKKPAPAPATPKPAPPRPPTTQEPEEEPEEPEVPVSSYSCNGMTATAVVEEGDIRREDGPPKAEPADAATPEVIVMLEGSRGLKVETQAADQLEDGRSTYAVNEANVAAGTQGVIYICGTPERDRVTSDSEYVVFYAGDGDDDFRGDASAVYGGNGADFLDVRNTSPDRKVSAYGGPGDDKIQVVPTGTYYVFGDSGSEIVHIYAAGNGGRINGGSGSDLAYPQSDTIVTNFERVYKLWLLDDPPAAWA